MLALEEIQDMDFGHDRMEGFIDLRAVITGGAGFIGSSLTAALVKEGWEITIFDNLSAGSKDNVAPLIRASPGPMPKLVVGDCTQSRRVKKVVRDCDVVFHFAANPEVRTELNNPSQCFRQNVFATHNVLEAFRGSKAQTIIFASTSTVYGEAKLLPTPEDYSPMEPISVYGASKLAGEALVSSYCHTLNKHGIILRFANVVGARSKHGVVIDFVSRLAQNPEQISILGDGTQNKSYIHVDDCVSAVIAAIANHRRQTVDIFNVGSTDQISVKEIAMVIARAMGLPYPKMSFRSEEWGGRGWVGDVKTMLLDVTRMKSIGWSPKLNSREAIEQTVKGINPEVDQKKSPMLFVDSLRGVDLDSASKSLEDSTFP